MEKRPLSLTIIAWVLVILALLGLAGIVMATTSAELAAKMAEQSNMPLPFQQAWTAIGAIVTLVVAYGIWKGQPWSRVLYVAWGVIGIVVGYLVGSPGYGMILGVVILVVISAFLFTNRANEWFNASGLALKRDTR
ncbi:hypothetical protein LZ519_07045 [Sphingomonas sp. RG327]|jgi:hypothetical protein|uniref:Uncharacterized protein n=1 Tax=Sphingomonas anseongensis TaxID=2908207 RepID=A0ABT0RFK9_9SPHN|nr:hypothetical protein [Sphingomonas anseongensis]MCL6679072.1 hypothetical protein [Sphingomonas anseongensis]